jgi:hypothetical protein
MAMEERTVHCLLAVPFVVATLFLREVTLKNQSEEDQLIHVGIGAFQKAAGALLGHLDSR